MLVQYIVPLIISVCLAAMVYILVYAQGKPAGGNVEIIICGEERTENVEHTVAMARQLSERYFKDAHIYIRGGEEQYVSALCRRYGVRRKE